MSKYFVIFFIALAAAVIFFFYPKKISNSNNEIIINDLKIKIEVAGDPYSRYRGLSGREELCANCGMLFVFPWQAKQTFVMRRMKFPLDIIWIKGDTIVKIDKNLPPEGAIPKNFYSSGEPVDYVLEVNGGFTDRNNIKTGDQAKF